MTQKEHAEIYSGPRPRASPPAPTSAHPLGFTRSTMSQPNVEVKTRIVPAAASIEKQHRKSRRAFEQSQERVALSKSPIPWCVAEPCQGPIAFAYEDVDDTDDAPQITRRMAPVRSGSTTSMTPL